MNTAVTEAEKRVALARWEGWEFNSWSPSRARYRFPRARRVLAPELPDYFHDGNAMIRLLEQAPEHDITITINDTSFGVYVHAQWPGSAGKAGLVDGVSYKVGTQDAPGLPAAVAEAVWAAIQ